MTIDTQITDIVAAATQPLRDQLDAQARTINALAQVQLDNNKLLREIRDAIGSAPAPGPVEPSPVPEPSPPAVPSDYRITRDGIRLMREGQPWRPVGVNAPTLIGSDTDDQIDRLFRTLPADSLIRTFAFANPLAPMSLDRAVQVVQRAERYGHVLLLCLSNGNHGEAKDAWRDGDKDPSWYSGGWRQSHLPGWIDRITAALRSSPAVMWQAMNEIGQNANGLTEAVVREFHHAVSSEIKSRAPDHLVIGSVQDAWQGHKFMSAAGSFGRVHDSPAIDAASMHEYEAFSVGNLGVANRFPAHRDQLAALGKPILIGEFGVGQKGATQTPEQRAVLVAQKVKAYAGAGALAALYWGVSEPWIQYQGGDTVTNREAAWERPDGPVVRAIAGA